MDHHDFHAGERAVQERAGERHIADQRLGLIADTVMDGARPFIARQFMVVVASVDGAGRVWASLLCGKPGFAHAEGPTLIIEAPADQRDRADPLWANLVAGASANADVQLGMLFIDLGARRRYRVNGVVRHFNRRHIEVDVHEAFPNCPQYIQRRQLQQRGALALPLQAARGTLLQDAVADIVRRADTVFVASRHVDGGADASHRGGNAGFIRIVDGQTLRIPDYRGNSLFNTLGNLEVDPHAGLVILDFERGQLLQLTGTATLQFNQDDPANETGGTHRFWDFKVEQWIVRDTPLALAWEDLDASPFNPGIAQTV
jgi:predicted pyridoxine 5'-phosphate oxidase superfamily flavin-nucleotide-binding protein